MPVDHRFLIRAYEPGDEDAILELFARSFHAPRSREHFDWKYRRNPAGNERISLAFDRAGEAATLAAHYAGYPVPFRVDGREAVAQQIGDTMTATSIRHIGRGPSSVLGRTALHFYATFCEGRVAFNYGFNVANIQKFSLRFLRSDRVEPVTYRVLDARAVRPISRLERWSRGYRLELVRHAGAEWDAFFERVAPAYRFCVRRNAEYLNWRYLEHPERNYAVVAIRKWFELVGWMVFRVEGERMRIGDLLLDPRFEDAAEVLLRHVVPGYPVALIEGWLPQRPRWQDLLLRGLGFEIQPEPQDLSLMCVPFVMADAVERMRDTLYYTWGDSDLF